MDVVFWEKDIYFSVAQEEHCDTNNSQIFDFFPPKSSQPESDRSYVENDRSPMTFPENDRSLLKNQPQPDLSSSCCPTHEEETYEILPTPETSSALIPHQSPPEDVFRACISDSKLKNRGKPPVHYKADLNAKGKYLINNYVSISRLSESRVHFVK
ncbi:unnamed protein product, partial [Prunus brigantina]